MKARALNVGNATIDQRPVWNRQLTRAYYTIEESHHDPDVNEVVDLQYTSLCVYDRETGKVKNLYTGHLDHEWDFEGDYRFDIVTGNDYRPYKIRWSPDGERLIFFALAYLGASINADGNPLLDVQVTTGNLRILSKGWRTSRGVRVDMMMFEDTVVFSPDEKTLLLVIGAGRFPFEEKRIASMAYPSGDRVWLTSEESSSRSPAWSTDGSRIAFVSNPEFGRDGEELEYHEKLSQTRLYVMRADGTGRRQLTFGQAYFDDKPRWIDPEKLQFIRTAKVSDSSKQQWDGIQSLWEVRIDGTGLRKVRDLPTD